jgi:hypothetical protein
MLNNAAHPVKVKVPLKPHIPRYLWLQLLEISVFASPELADDTGTTPRICPLRQILHSVWCILAEDHANLGAGVCFHLHRRFH